MLTVSHLSGGWMRRYAWLAPVAATCVLLGITAWIYSIVSFGLVGWSHALVPFPTPTPGPLGRLGGLMWGSSAILFLTVSAAAAVVLLTTIYRSINDAARHIPSRRTVAVVAVTVAVVFLLVAISPLSADTPFPVREIVDRMLAKRIGSAVDVLWLVTLIAAALVLTGACACLIELRVASPIAVEPADEHDLTARSAAVGQHLAAALRIQNRRLQSVLFAGAAVLVAGIIELDSLYRWAVTTAGITTPKDAVSVISAAATVPTGTFFSLFLTAVYVPAALILREHASTLARIALPGTAEPVQAKWLQENGLITPISSQITSLLALLGPVLASGPLNTLGQVFG